ncbi:MAG: 4Fe-4S binding protein [Lachnospiraceae bacterium]|nr:4Fe-4S binding protein [Lachnospiraceae bacterium]
MVKFDSKVQMYKFYVLREVARLAYEDKLADEIDNIPIKLFPDDNSQGFIDIYKTREIAKMRVKLATGGNIYNKNVIEVMELACDECPLEGYEVTNACRGCLAHRCEENCKFTAITFDKDGRAQIDPLKCKSCGACAKACPYSAIRQNIRPCRAACKVGAMGFNEKKAAKIDNEKCIRCGACVYQCPFGAIMDKSYMLNAIDLIKNSENSTKYKVYAVVAPAISSQFSDVKLGQVITGIKKLGFSKVIEAAFGADIVAEKETEELVEKGFLTSSCCPAFVKFIQTNYKDVVKDISSNPSPMAAVAEYIKKKEPTSKVVFIGPCIAKKMEVKDTKSGEFIDVALTFEELEAMFDAKNFDLSKFKETVLDDASYFGRIFARSGGLAEAVKEGLLETGNEKFELRAEICNGIEQCNLALLKKNKGILNANFIEGMACVGGYIGGPGCLNHEPKDKNEVDLYGKEAAGKKILDVTKNANLTPF